MVMLHGLICGLAALRNMNININIILILIGIRFVNVLFEVASVALECLRFTSYLGYIVNE
jgi:hypothetical protein